MSSPSPQTQIVYDFDYTCYSAEEPSGELQDCVAEIDLETSVAPEPRPEASSHDSFSEGTETEVSDMGRSDSSQVQPMPQGDLRELVLDLMQQVRDLSQQVGDLSQQVRDLRLIGDQNSRKIEALQTKKGVKAKLVKLLL